MPKLFFTRYTLMSARAASTKLEILLDGLRNEAFTEQRGFVYRFIDTEVFEFDGSDYIAGELVKYDPDDQEQVVNERTRKIDSEYVPNKVMGRARFIIDPRWSLLMFCEVPRAISPQTFIGISSKLFEQNHENFFTSFNISPIKERYSFIERVRKYKSIKKVSITLFPSNPNFDERWRAIDERLQKNHIDKYREIQESTANKGRILIDDETENKFLMSEDGYGSSRVSGIDENGGEKTISTSDSERDVFQDVSPDLEKPADLLEQIYQTLLNIIDRTN